MAKNQEIRWNEKVQQLVDDEVQRRVAQDTHKLKQRMIDAVTDKDAAVLAADNLRRELADEKAMVKILKGDVTWMDNELARIRVTVRSLQDQAVKEGKF